MLEDETTLERLQRRRTDLLPLAPFAYDFSAVGPAGEPTYVWCLGQMGKAGRYAFAFRRPDKLRAFSDGCPQ